jgi:predicted nucleotidyltransferase
MDFTLDILKKHKEYFFKKYPIKTLALFGSRSRSDFNEDSDIDILVEFTKPVGMDFIRLAHELEDIFHKNVDLVTKNSVKDAYMKFIEKDLLYV